MFEQIRSNQLRSHLVVGLMGCLLVATGVALGGGLGGGEGGLYVGGLVALALWAVLWVVAVTSGDRILLALSGATEIRKQDHPQLFNVVEEMTIAAALPKPPRVYVMDDPAPNAFATGRRPEDAAVTVTTGLLKILDRDELQGVVAHEIGHVRNRDIRLMTTAGIMVGTVVILAEVGRRALFFGGGRRSRTSKGDGQAQLLMLVVSLAFMILAPILAQLLYLALSRRREYLADASGAVFTRYPEGLARALEKLGGSRTAPAKASRVTAPMFIVSPEKEPRRMAAKGGEGASVFATHPPLAERIRILRAMGGNAGLGAYEAAYRRATGKSVVGRRTLAEAQDVPAREPSAEDGHEPEDELRRVREATDALLLSAGYQMVDCPCGARLKAPASQVSRLSNCPRCGRPV